jgi:hypothetical protein
MRAVLYFVLLVGLWVTFIPAMNVIEQAPNELFIWFIMINIVVSVKLLIDLHTQGWRL